MVGSGTFKVSIRTESLVSQGLSPKDGLGGEGTPGNPERVPREFTHRRGAAVRTL